MLRIAVTGPESSGKTTLAEKLAEHLQISLISEYSRIYLNELNREYTEDDLLKMAAGHYEQIQSSNAHTTIVDTDFIVFHVWSNYKYNKLSNEIEKLILSNVFDLHILCKPDIPWEHDPLRENPNDRDVLFDRYVQALDHYGKNYIVAEGNLEDRIKNSIQTIKFL